MKMLKTLVPVAVLLLLVSGCYVQSINPYYTDEDLVKDDALIGTWLVKDNSSDKQEEWAFENNEDNSLVLRITKEDATDTVKVRTFELNGVKLMDLYPGESGIDPQTHFISAFQWVPVHLLAKYEVDAEQGQLLVYPLSVEWFKDMALKRKLDIEYTVYEKNQVLLTADSAQIREFLSEHLDEAFAEEYGRMELAKKTE